MKTLLPPPMPDEVAPSSAPPSIELRVESMGGHAIPSGPFIGRELVRIGAHQTNDVVLHDPLVSKFHCRLRLVGDVWRVEDLGSTNGTRLDNVRVRDADLPLPSAVLRLGESVVRVREAGSLEEPEVPRASTFGSLSTRSPVMERLFGMLARVAPTDTTVLLQGESGVGKEVIATELVQQGPRRDGPLVIVDGGAIATGLVETELFGHARGSFTGAHQERMGAFEAANGGTLFLDEIGELPLDIQAKLLRALESREVRRIGETRMRKVDVRVIAATNRSLEVEVNQRRFREDLYFRLSVVTLTVPPLRERPEDIPDLVLAFARESNRPGAAELFTPEVLAELAAHPWPGNVRELRNYVERTSVLRKVVPSRSGTHRIVTAPEPQVDLDLSFREAKEAAMAAFDRSYLGALIRWSGGNVSLAARRAGMDRIHLHRLLQRYGLRVPTERTVA